jgi:hypothetical protein
LKKIGIIDSGADIQKIVDGLIDPSDLPQKAG